jgi:7,8-dihydropterin-6-yl-methyl-4-(beta-D-ribofuranosyl)aminobenzene 5'-phosphate synthase
MKITILCNNSVKTFCSCIAEHGFSAYIETDSGNFLFDTGKGIGIIENAMILNKDLHNIKALILSHGHHDHCGGLEKVFKYINKPLPVYTHPSVFSIRYSLKGEKKSFAGIPFRREYLECLGAEFRMITDFTQIAGGLYITGEVERKNSFELPEKNLLVKSEITGEIEVDPFLDDYSLAINTQKGIILLLGCAHAGLDNIMSHVAEKLYLERFYAVIGGTHLADADSNRTEKTIEALNKYHLQKVGTCHCTGPEKEAILKTALGDRFFFAQAGCEIII